MNNVSGDANCNLPDYKHFHRPNEVPKKSSLKKELPKESEKIKKSIKFELIANTIDVDDVKVRTCKRVWPAEIETDNIRKQAGRQLYTVRQLQESDKAKGEAKRGGRKERLACDVPEVKRIKEHAAGRDSVGCELSELRGAVMSIATPTHKDTLVSWIGLANEKEVFRDYLDERCLTVDEMIGLRNSLQSKIKNAYKHAPTEFRLELKKARSDYDRLIPKEFQAYLDRQDFPLTEGPQENIPLRDTLVRSLEAFSHGSISTKSNLDFSLDMPIQEKKDFVIGLRQLIQVGVEYIGNKKWHLKWNPIYSGELHLTATKVDDKIVIVMETDGKAELLGNFDHSEFISKSQEPNAEIEAEVEELVDPLSQLTVGQADFGNEDSFEEEPFDLIEPVTKWSAECADDSSSDGDLSVKELTDQDSHSTDEESFSSVYNDEYENYSFNNEEPLCEESFDFSDDFSDEDANMEDMENKFPFFPLDYIFETLYKGTLQVEYDPSKVMAQKITVTIPIANLPAAL